MEGSAKMPQARERSKSKKAHLSSASCLSSGDSGTPHQLEQARKIQRKQDKEYELKASSGFEEQVRGPQRRRSNACG